MTELRAQPLSIVKTIDEVDALARTLSRQALDLYRDLARHSAGLRNAPSQEAFERVSAMLRKDEVAEPATPDVEVPEIFQDGGLSATRLLTPYAAYSLAVRNQERAFAFWTYVSANSPDAGVRAEAERLARREMAQVKSFRAQRRQAFHANPPPGASREALRSVSTEGLRRQAGETEGALAALHDRIAVALAEIGDARSAMMKTIAAEERQNAEQLGVTQESDEGPEPLPRDGEALLGLATEHLEAAVESYLDAAEVSRREEVIAVAQDLADRGIRRLSLLR